MNSKKMILAAAAALMLLLGAGVAYATGSDGDPSGQPTGPDIEKAKSVALEHVDGHVTGTEVGDEEGAYEVEVTREDGSQVDVHLDRGFDVLGTPSDREGPDGKDTPTDGGG